MINNIGGKQPEVKQASPADARNDESSFYKCNLRSAVPC